MDNIDGQRAKLIEVGWIIAGNMDSEDLAAVRQAHDDILDYLSENLSEFEWRMPIVERRELVQTNREEPVVLLDYSITEREIRHWDFALTVTNADLESHYKPYALGTPASSVNIAIFSTSRIDPQGERGPNSERERIRIMKVRVFSLALHLFGHLNGLQHDSETESVMYNFAALSDLDEMRKYSADHLTLLRDGLREVADVRLEEEPVSFHPLQFYIRGIWINRRKILKVVLQGKPWRFPLRLSRLTIAAFSTLFILMMTAEAWDLGMSRSRGLVAGFSIVALVVTSIFVLVRQRLLLRRGTSRLSEQIVSTNTALVIIVVTGMITTYIVLFGVSLALAYLLFSPDLVREWAVSLNKNINSTHYLVFAAFIASLGILIGALGASFEGQHYFRHIAYMDEET